jgi:hypothetical protein
MVRMAGIPISWMNHPHTVMPMAGMVETATPVVVLAAREEAAVVP